MKINQIKYIFFTFTTHFMKSHRLGKLTKDNEM